jgi:hypothetical protein
VNNSIVQLNSVGHTGADGFRRLANQALFSGTVAPGLCYFVVDDFVGQGGTLANLICFIRPRAVKYWESHGLDGQTVLGKAGSR